MSWTSRLVCLVALLLQSAAPLAAYFYVPASPDFGALCSAQHPLKVDPAGAPAPQSSDHHAVHCALCGGAAGPALPGHVAPAWVGVAQHAEPVERLALSVPSVAALLPRARGPPQQA